MKKLIFILYCHAIMLSVSAMMHPQKETSSLCMYMNSSYIQNSVSFFSKLFVFKLRDKKILSRDGREVFILIYDLFAQHKDTTLPMEPLKKTIILTITDFENGFTISIQERNQTRPCFDHHWHDVWTREQDLMEAIKDDLEQELILILCLTDAFDYKKQKLCCLKCNKVIFLLKNLTIDHNVTILPCHHIMHMNCVYTLSACKCCPFCRTKSRYTNKKSICATRHFNDLTAEF